MIVSRNRNFLPDIGNYRCRIGTELSRDEVKNGITMTRKDPLSDLILRYHHINGFWLARGHSGYCLYQSSRRSAEFSPNFFDFLQTRLVFILHYS